ncbi:MAG: nucleotidyltransferase family protein, partial [Ruminococcus sp.]|nr:nucleotidyltransferase family protein [Ruminococcus sp.]
LRTMGDIDLLYKPEQHHMFKTLMLSLGYGDYQEGRKNDTYLRPPFVTVEAHRELVESGSDYADYYHGIWGMARPKRGMQYAYEMSVEDELVFNIVHLAEHFKEGGAGVRFIIDVYVYSQIKMGNDYVERELKKLGLSEFYHHILILANYWFADGEGSELTEKLADFIMGGGIFGDNENAAALAVEEGRAKHLIKVCFPDYKSMKSMFPWLNGKGILLPYAWGLRGVRAIRHRKENINRHMIQVRTGNTEKGKAIKQFYSECGL